MWVTVGLRRVLVRMRMVVGGRMPSPTFGMMARRWRAFRIKVAFVAEPPSAGVGECHPVSAAGSRHGHLDTARSRSSAAALMAAN